LLRTAHEQTCDEKSRRKDQNIWSGVTLAQLQRMNLYIYGLLNDAFSYWDYIISSNRMIKKWLNWEKCSICLEGLETKKILSQVSRVPDRDMNQEPPEY
jgi:hypothetical protein